MSGKYTNTNTKIRKYTHKHKYINTTRLSSHVWRLKEHHHLADPLQSERLQPNHWNVPPLPEGEVPDHVPALHRLAQQEEQDLCQLPPQSKQAAGQALVHATVFSL